MSHPCNRIEEMLRVWEDFFFLNGLMAEFAAPLGFSTTDFPLEGANIHWQDLRRHLREIAVANKPLDHLRFATASQYVLNNYGSTCQFPIYLRDWMASSKRVFHLDEELQALLAGLSFGKMRVADVLFPFDSFLVTLEVPLMMDLGRYDAILISRIKPPPDAAVSKLPVEHGLSMALLSTSLGGYMPLAKYDKDLLRNVCRKNSPSAHNHLLAYEDRIPDPGPFVSTLIPKSVMKRALANEPIPELAEAQTVTGKIEPDFSIHFRMAVNNALRYVLGLCLYLTSLPAKSPHRSDWEKPLFPGKPDPRAISNDALICHVTSRFTLSAEVKAQLLSSLHGSGREVCVHPRNSHFRRRPGFGHDPDAPKVVIVGPTLVRKDRLRPGEMPGAGVATCKP
ncbi:MAG: hypothetical protein WCV84_03245 [Patescibacteria group bacterium]